MASPFDASVFDSAREESARELGLRSELGAIAEKLVRAFDPARGRRDDGHHLPGSPRMARQPLASRVEAAKSTDPVLVEAPGNAKSRPRMSEPEPLPERQPGPEPEPAPAEPAAGTTAPAAQSVEPAPAPAAEAATPAARRLRIEFPRELPISARVGDIAAALRDHPVVIVAGATGSGKTTQLPKVALELGRGTEKCIGVTQPRRIAATSVANRVASELACPLGAEVGYQIRFDDRTSEATRLKFMTDGILLAEIQTDRLLRRYDTLIIDEAHERSLTIDFLLGWLHRILPERPDLKVVVSSATIETERFAAFFGNAPVLQVEGRTYPVDVLYEPYDPDLDLHDAVASAVESIGSLDSRGDILVFLPGEREIREAEQELLRRNLRNTTVQPLYSRLSGAEQSRVFAPVPGRRIILATNVAETSLTLPGIVYVVDTGIARLSRYDPRTGTTRLQIEAISQASADQRKGRCGRVREGICVRMYDEASYQGRPAFTDPEIKRTGLAGVILRMKSLGLGDVESFPFLDAPNPRSITEGYRVLEELGALDDERELTPLGRQLARLPVDPRIGRMILAGAERRCLAEVLVVAAALELQDPRERPRGQEHKADQLHQRFRDERSDFVALLRLWAFVREAQRKGTSQLKRVCKESYLSFVRVREWFEIHRQLAEVARELGIDSGDGGRELPARGKRGDGAERGEHRGRREHNGRGGRPGDNAPNAPNAPNAAKDAKSATAAKLGRRPSEPPRANAAGESSEALAEPADSDALHQALLGGLLSRIGMYNPEQRVYVGARQTRFVIHPSSALAKKPPAWVMAHELVQTTQLFARNVARLDPNWLDRVGSHLLKRSYTDPHWSEKAARAKIREHATLYGLPVLKDRSIDYAIVAPVRARLMFLEHALVRNEYESPGEYQKQNKELLDEVSRLRDKARKSEMLADEDVRLAFFDQRVPASVTSGKGFEAWREQAERKNPKLLHLTLADVLGSDEELDPADYPDELTLHGVKLPLSYKFDPSADDDGVTVSVPLALLPQLDPGELDWTIPAWHREKIAAVLEGLSRAQRKELGSIPELSQRLARELAPFSGPLIPALVRAVQAATGVAVPHEALRVDTVPGYLRLTCQVVGERGKPIAQSRELPALIREHGGQAREAIARTSSPPKWERSGITRWDFDDMPPFVNRSVLGSVVRAYPAIVDKKTAVDLALLESREAADAATRVGLRRLFALNSQRALVAFGKRVPPPLPRVDRMPVSRADSDAWRDQVLSRVVDEAFGLAASDAWPRTRSAFDAQLTAGMRRIDDAFDRVSRALVALSTELDKTQRALAAAAKQPSGTHAARDIRAQLDLLVTPDLALSVELDKLEQYPRYLRAAQTRLGRAISDPRKDADKLAPFAPVWAAFLDKRAKLRDRDGARALYWEFEELRVAIFAPELKPAFSVSVTSVARRLDELR
ncbi:MAG TPA: ATP-dependent RNA helicase HrpA [Polyangiaceae bacterium]|nr:ATP-dependent RNA helicase HrpA [Polyangiaceae bacterium]